MNIAEAHMYKSTPSLFPAALRVGVAFSLLAGAGLAQASTVTPTVLWDNLLSFSVQWSGDLDDGSLGAPALTYWGIGDISATSSREDAWTFTFSDIKHITAPHLSDTIPGNSVSFAFDYPGSGSFTAEVAHPAIHSDRYALRYTPSEITLTGTHVVPIPAAAWMMGSGLAALLGFGTRRRMTA